MSGHLKLLRRPGRRAGTWSLSNEGDQPASPPSIVSPSPAVPRAPDARRRCSAIKGPLATSPTPRGKHSRRTPQELEAIGDRVGLDGTALTRASRLVAKVDSAAVQDGFDL
jgi:hypothetical protein